VKGPPCLRKSSETTYSQFGPADARHAQRLVVSSGRRLRLDNLARAAHRFTLPGWFDALNAAKSSREDHHRISRPEPRPKAVDQRAVMDQEIKTPPSWKMVTDIPIPVPLTQTPRSRAKNYTGAMSVPAPGRSATFKSHGAVGHTISGSRLLLTCSSAQRSKRYFTRSIIVTSLSS
jgi:hypothetical protein